MKQMKDSKIEWIGEIPKDWKLIRLKGLFVDRCGGAWGDEAKNDVNDIVCIRVADFDFEKQIVKDSDKTLRNYQPQVICKLKLEENDLLIEKSGGGEKTPVGRTILATGCSGYLFANFIDRLRIRDSHYSKFVAYLFRSLYFNGIILPYVKQTTGIQNLDVENLLRENIFVPLSVKQQKIADFLDDKCKKIDSLIAHEESTIEELKAYKQSIITESVTKGLDKSVPVKDSGVEWISEIPESWEVKPTKSLFAFGKGLPITKADLRSSGIRVISYGQIHAKYNRVAKIDERLYRFVDSKYLETNTDSLVKKGDFIFADTSEDIEGSGDFVYIDKNNQIFAGYHSLVLKSRRNFDNKYLAYLFMSSLWKNQIRREVYGIKVFSITRSIISKTTAILPPEDEQTKIVEYLDKKCANIDSLIAIKQQKIEELKEYKKSLIYEYVTGKKEVVNE